MKTTIEGLKVTVPAKELAMLCRDRAKWHEARAIFYEKTKNALPDAEEEMPPDMTTSNSKRPEAMMKERVDQHRSAAAELLFIAGHLDSKAVYLLDRSDLHKLGVVKERY